MKKNWLDPEVVALDMQNTFGGPEDPDAIDGPVEWNPDLSRWEWPAGLS